MSDNRRSAPEHPSLVALEISHPDISLAVRIVADTKDHVINGETYRRAGFQGRFVPADGPDEVPRCQIVIKGGQGDEGPGIDSRLIALINDTRGGAGASIRVIQFTGTGMPVSTIEYELMLEVTAASYDDNAVVIDLGYEYLLGRPAVKKRYDPETVPGLF